MSSIQSTNRSTATSSTLTAESSEAIRHLADAASRADAVVLGAGSGLSAAAGLSYSGPRFARLFPDFIEEFGLSDMYSSGFYPFPTPEHRWAYWSRHIMANRYDNPILPLYQDLRGILEGLGDTRRGSGLFRPHDERRPRLRPQWLRRVAPLRHSGRLRVVAVLRSLPRRHVVQRVGRAQDGGPPAGPAHPLILAAHMPPVRGARGNESASG